MKILLTGGHGFLGSRIAERLKNHDVYCPKRSEFDLVNQDDTDSLVHFESWDIIINCAGKVGGIEANLTKPGSHFYDNIAPGLFLIEAARKYRVQKFVQIGTVCSYPKFANLPFMESELWAGRPDNSNASYGLAKRCLGEMLKSYYKQYGLCAFYPLLTNLYGPGDDFSPPTSHVIPAIIRKLVEADMQRKPEVVLLGDGTTTRDFLFVEDAADAIVFLMDRVGSPEPINIATGYEMKIKDMAEEIAGLVGYEGRIIFGSKDLNGQPRRRLSTSKATELGWQAKISISEGLKKTVEWYQETRIQNA